MIVILYNCVCDKKKNSGYHFFPKPISDYGKMLKYRENIGKPIYRSISNFKAHRQNASPDKTVSAHVGLILIHAMTIHYDIFIFM